MTTKDMIARAQAWVTRGADEHERAHHMLDADADQYSDEAKDAEEDGEPLAAEGMRRNAALYCAARDALDAVPMLVAEIERLRAEFAEVLVSNIATAVREAVKKEREACVQACEDEADECLDVAEASGARSCAGRIRARGDVTVGGS